MTLSEIRAILEAHKREGRLVSPREWAGMVEALLAKIYRADRIILLLTADHNSGPRYSRGLEAAQKWIQDRNMEDGI